MLDRQGGLENSDDLPAARRTARRPTELKVALDCLVYYVGMLAFGQPIGSFESCASRHYALHGVDLAPERLALLDALRPLMLEGAMADLNSAEMIAQLLALGWRSEFLKREIA